MDEQHISSKEKMATKVMLNYLRELRGEMHLRIDRAFKLSLYKLLSLGTIASFGLIHPEIFADWRNGTFYAMLLPFIAICFDLLIANNFRWMNTTGTFIRQRIESYFKEKYNLSLYESEAHNFPAIMNRINEIAISIVVTIYAYFRLPTELTKNQMFAIEVITILFLIISSNELLKSRSGYMFQNENEN